MYGTAPTKELLKDGMKFCFERMCIVHESILTMVHHFFSIYIDVYYLILKFSLFSPMYIHSIQFILCLYMEGEEEENNQHHEQNSPKKDRKSVV